MPDSTGQKQAETQFKAGQSGNPAGRPKGSRNKLGESFLEKLHEDFQEHGVDAIKACRVASPETYVRVIAGLLPKEFKAEVSHRLASELTDDILASIATGSSDRVVAPSGDPSITH